MKTIVSICFSFVIVLTYIACDYNDTPVENEYGELYDALKKDFEKWDTYSEEEKIAKLSESYYLGYNPADLSLLGVITGNETYFDYVNDIISIYKNNFVVNGMLRPTSLLGGATWRRDQFARDNRYLYEAFFYTGNMDILHLVEQQVSLWLTKVPRAEHNGYVLFPYGILEDGTLASYEIDPNQNLQIASLFSYLYWEPKSKYYKNKLFKDIIFNEVNAVISLQKENGSLPIREYLPLVEDSNYGGYSGDMLYHLAQMWGEFEWIKATIKIGEWLYRDFSEVRPWNTPEDGANFRTENYNSFNLIGRILPFYAAGLSKSEIFKWINYIEETFPNDELNMGARWYFYQSIPRSYLSENYIPNNLRPFIFNDDSDYDNIKFRIVGDKIDTIDLQIVDRDGLNIFHEQFTDIVSLSRTILMKKGMYSYIIEVQGNNNRISRTKGTFCVEERNEISLFVQVFDSKNTFIKQLSTNYKDHI